MHTVITARHPDDIDLSWEQVQQALRALQGSRVAVHHDRCEGAVGRAGCAVLAIIQGPVLINVRRS